MGQIAQLKVLVQELGRGKREVGTQYVKRILTIKKNKESFLDYYDVIIFVDAS